MDGVFDDVVAEIVGLAVGDCAFDAAARSALSGNETPMNRPPVLAELAVTPSVCRGEPIDTLDDEFQKTKTRAEAGDVDAQDQLAKLYSSGKATEKTKWKLWCGIGVSQCKRKREGKVCWA